MDIKDLIPRSGNDTYRIGDSDDLVVMESIATVPSGKICLQSHGIIIIVTQGIAQFEYDGVVIKLQKDDLFLYMSHSIVQNFMTSSDFNCRQVWFTRGELWDINLYARTSLSDLTYLKQHPVVHLTEDDVTLLDDYFQLLCRRMKDNSPILYSDIVRSLSCTMMLEILAMLRRSEGQKDESDMQEGGLPGFHKRRLAEKFMQMLEQSDGRVRKVDDFASELNITPKYLSTILKETMNRRPSDMIHFFTMKAIEHRLRYTDMTMQEIANDLNFPNASFFGKYFKKYSGMTPLEYRVKYQNGEVKSE